VTRVACELVQSAREKCTASQKKTSNFSPGEGQDHLLPRQCHLLHFSWPSPVPVPAPRSHNSLYATGKSAQCVVSIWRLYDRRISTRHNVIRNPASEMRSSFARFLAFSFNQYYTLQAANEFPLNFSEAYIIGLKRNTPANKMSLIWARYVSLKSSNGWLQAYTLPAQKGRIG